MDIRKVSIAKRAVLFCAFLTLVSCLIGSGAFFVLSKVNSITNTINEYWVPGLIQAQELSNDIASIRLEGQRIRATELSSVIATSKQIIVQNEANITTTLFTLKNAHNDPEKTAIANQLSTAVNTYFQSLNELIGKIENNSLSQQRSIELNKELAVKGSELYRHLGALIKYNEVGVSKATRSADQTFNNAIIILVAVILAAVIINILLGMLFIRSIVTPLNQAVILLNSISQGNLNNQIEINEAHNDETSLLFHSMRTMQHNLSSMVEKITLSSQNLSSAAFQINEVMAQSNNDLRSQSEQIDQSSESISQMNIAIDEVSHNASVTSALSQSSDQDAQQAKANLDESMRAISELVNEVLAVSSSTSSLEKSTDEIASVLVVIQSIADQTNLLALNAAIEAARAGDYGRGFSVVAEEVRSLAHRTQESTKEIESLISNIQHHTKNTVESLKESSQKAGYTLTQSEQVSTSLEKVTRAISEINGKNIVIATATEQQAMATKELNRNIDNVKELSTSTASGANQTFVATQELNNLAADLNDAVMSFKI
ncbi:HAMP domain-containing methyl-accepting chemotaxis protein [uncultured Pseudoalteromonas sp.]|uniref:methyl-accepting chemotaxis protein n=1 Tax=uncultured Pseudoalteromonas sp. TaxID=114053 RepID=UPI002594C242|nr:HAMP domain-containing methyl-accepting chemotaxis protein [uncultured Pseudoalteromonas sp.]